MKTKLEVFAAAKTLSTNKSREDLTKDITAQQGIVNKITKERDETADTANRVAKNVELENATDELMQYAMAREIQDHTSHQAEDLFNAVAKTLGDVGITVKVDRASSVSLADRLGNNNKSFWTRLF